MGRTCPVRAIDKCKPAAVRRLSCVFDISDEHPPRSIVLKSIETRCPDMLRVVAIGVSPRRKEEPAYCWDQVNRCRISVSGIGGLSRPRAERYAPPVACPRPRIDAPNSQAICFFHFSKPSTMGSPRILRLIPIEFSRLQNTSSKVRNSTPLNSSSGIGRTLRSDPSDFIRTGYSPATGGSPGG